MITREMKTQLDRIAHEFDAATKLYRWYVGGLITREEYDYAMQEYRMYGL